MQAMTMTRRAPASVTALAPQDSADTPNSAAARRWHSRYASGSIWIPIVPGIALGAATSTTPAANVKMAWMPKRMRRVMENTRLREYPSLVRSAVEGIGLSQADLALLSLHRAQDDAEREPARDDREDGGVHPRRIMERSILHEGAEKM